MNEYNPDGESFWNVDSRLRLRFSFRFVIIFLVSVIVFYAHHYQRGTNVYAQFSDFWGQFFYSAPILLELVVTHLIDIALFAFAVTFFFQEGERAMQYSRQRIEDLRSGKDIDELVEMIKARYPEVDIEEFKDEIEGFKNKRAKREKWWKWW